MDSLKVELKRVESRIDSIEGVSRDLPARLAFDGESWQCLAAFWVKRKHVEAYGERHATPAEAVDSLIGMLPFWTRAR